VKDWKREGRTDHLTGKRTFTTVAVAGALLLLLSPSSTRGVGQLPIYYGKRNGGPAATVAAAAAVESFGSATIFSGGRPLPRCYCRGKRKLARIRRENARWGEEA
jgi:hypothetical protein